jgi:biopolymer transport protein ExbB
MNLIEMFLKGGIFMWPILLCLIISIAVIISRYIILGKARMNIPVFMVRIRGLIKRRDIDEAIQLCLDEKAAAANIIRKGLKKYKLGPARMQEAIENAGKLEIAKLEKGLSVLATIISIVPLLGFLGTLTGLVSVFMSMQYLKGNAVRTNFADGMWEALITTIFGLIVGIIGIIFHNHLLSLVKKIVMQMEIVSSDIADVIEDSAAVNSDKEIE